jgi:hypothetical protein
VLSIAIGQTGPRINPKVVLFLEVIYMLVGTFNDRDWF